MATAKSSLLPIEAAVHASILPRLWQNCCRYIPDLDLSEMPNNGISQVLHLHGVPICLFNVQTADQPAIDQQLAALSNSSSSSLCTHDLATISPSSSELLLAISLVWTISPPVIWVCYWNQTVLDSMLSESMSNFLLIKLMLVAPVLPIRPSLLIVGDINCESY